MVDTPNFKSAVTTTNIYMKNIEFRFSFTLRILYNDVVKDIFSYLISLYQPKRPHGK